MDTLSWKKINEMTLEELCECKDELPDVVDLNSLNSENFEDFKEVTDFLAKEEIEEKDYKRDIDEISELNKNFKYGLFAGYASIFPIVVLHEALHAVGVKFTGGKIYDIGFGTDYGGFYGYVSATTPNEISDVFVGALPNFILPMAGFYLIKKGNEEKDLIPIGIGLSAIMMHTTSFLSPGEDFYEIGRIFTENTRLPCSDYAKVILGGTFLGINYLAAYGIANKIDDIKNCISDIYKKIKR